MTTAHPMAQFQAIPWTDHTRMLIEVGPARYHPITGASAGIEGHTVRELPTQAGPSTPKQCPHGRGFNCRQCWPATPTTP